MFFVVLVLTSNCNCLQWDWILKVKMALSKWCWRWSVGVDECKVWGSEGADLGIKVQWSADCAQYLLHPLSVKTMKILSSVCLALVTNHIQTNPPHTLFSIIRPSIRFSIGSFAPLSHPEIRSGAEVWIRTQTAKLLWVSRDKKSWVLFW